MRTAFSLVELSIVLVILGLLTGGILTGQSLIQAAELRSISREHGEIIAAANHFRDKYFALAGDMNNATRFWQRERLATPSYQATCISNSGAATSSSINDGACDGNGDGRLTSQAAFAADENAQFWQHLHMAGLLVTPNRAQAGTNFAGPLSDRPSRYRNTAFWAATWGNAYFFIPPPMQNMHVLTLGKYWSSAAPNIMGAIRPEDAWNIDTKMDDGNAGTGRVRAAYT